MVTKVAIAAVTLAMLSANVLTASAAPNKPPRPPKQTIYNVFQDKLDALICTTSEPKGQTKVAGPFSTSDDCLAAMTTPPAISYVVSPSTPTGLADWYTGDATLAWAVNPAPFYA